jgi:hypothetical protein
MSQRTFTLDEAQALLPVLETLLRRAIEGKKVMDEIKAEFEQIAGRIFVSGGLLLNPIKLAKRKAVHDKAAQSVKDTLDEIDSTGVQVKDLDMGLLDFPCAVDDQVILLCWKLGEGKIAHWHGLEEGYKGRKPITDRIAKAKNKPN